MLMEGGIRVEANERREEEEDDAGDGGGKQSTAFSNGLSRRTTTWQTYLLGKVARYGLFLAYSVTHCHLARRCSLDALLHYTLMRCNQPLPGS